MEIWKTAARADGKTIHNLMEKDKPFPTGLQTAFPLELDLPAPEGLPPEERMDLHGAIARLPEKYQDVIKLKYFDGYTIREISEATGMPQGTVSVYLRRAVKELQTLLKEEPVCKKK